MITVNNQLLVSRQAMRRPTNYPAQTGFNNGAVHVDAIEYWNRNFHILKQLDPGLKFSDLDEINDIFFEWAEAPVLVGKHQGTYQFVAMAPNRPNQFNSVQQNTQDKNFPTERALFQALLGNYRATHNRNTEESLAFKVLALFPRYEKEFLDTLIVSAHKLLAGQSPYKSGKSYYQDAATVNWCAQNILAEMYDPEPLARMYRKIAGLHDICRAFRWYCRPDEASMRMDNDKYSLKEDHQVVAQDRESGTSIWAGTSGSSGDITSAAVKLGLVDPRHFAMLSFAIGAFFHFMPTVGSSTHTYVEVFRGVDYVLKKNGVALQLPLDGSIPNNAPA